MASIATIRKDYQEANKYLDEIGLDVTADLSNKIAVLARDINANKVRSLKDHAQVIDSVISSKVEVLRDFAYKYSYNVIHSDHFHDLDGNKIILVTKSDHRHYSAA